jgi:WD40 repeat protein/serine/threonine protein kinase
MGDAGTEPAVQNAELDTIDGVERPVDAVVPAALPIAARVAGAIDYPELVTVDRRHYVISGEIAKGGMGRVLAARDLRLGRAVAIKELLPKNRDAARRFEREARITARLQHPSIIHIYEAGVWNGGEPFYAMTKVAGRSLDKVVAERATLEERLGLVPNVIAVADALAYAHNEHVIHRDLKPANVLVGAFGETVVIDWGLAKDLGVPLDPKESLQLRMRAMPGETNVGSIVGTPAYMPPEQARGESVDQRADVYALGALLYHVLVGAPPYTGTSSAEVLECVKTKPCVPVREREPGAPADLVAIVAKAMARKRGDRYADADELARDLKRFQTGQLVAAHHYTTPQLVWRGLRRHRVAVAIATISVVVLAAVGTLSISRILEEKHKDERRRNTLLEERGRTDLLDGQSGRALANLVGAAHDGGVGGARGFLIADAMRPFEAELATFVLAEPGPRIVAFSPDGRHVAAAGTEGVELWTIDGVREASFSEPGGPPVLLRFDPRGTRLITARADHTIRLSTISGLHQRDLTGHRAPITDADFSFDGELLVTVAADGVTFVWDLRTGKQWTSRCTLTGSLIAARFSPRADRVVVANDDNTLCVRGVHDTHDEPFVIGGHRGRITTVRWNPDPEKHQILTASADGTAMLWDASTEHNLARGKDLLAPLRHKVGAITSAEFSSDGRSIVTAGADHLVEIWRIPDELRIDDPTQAATHAGELVGHTDEVERAVFSPGDELIATAGRDRQAKVWVAKTGQLIATFEHADVVESVAFSADRKRLFTTSHDGTARSWDITRGEQQRAYDVASVVHAIAVGRDGSVVSATSDGLVTRWRPAPIDQTTTAVPQPAVLRGHMGRVFAVAFSPDGTRLVSGGEDEDALVWDASTGTSRPLGPHAEPIRSVAFSPDGQTIATAGDEGQVRVFSAQTGTLARTLRHAAGITALAYSPDGAMLVGIGEDDQLLVWSGALATSRRLSVHALAFRRDGNALVASGPSDTDIFLIDHGRLAERSSLRLDGPTGDVRAVTFTPDGSRVITGSADGVIRLWDARKGKLVGRRDAHGGPITSIAVTDDGTTLWVGSEDHSVRAWDIHVESRPVGELEQFLARRVAWRLAPDDVVKLKTEGDGDGER